MTSGNTDLESVNAKLSLAQDLRYWRNEFSVSMLHATNAGKTYAERYESRIETSRKLGKHLSWFSGARFENDRFGGFEYQMVASTGYRYSFVQEQSTQFNGQIGAGYRRLESGVETEWDLIARGDLNFRHGLTQAAVLVNRFTSEAGAISTRLENQLTLQIKIFASCAVAVSATVRFNSDPPAGAQRTDRLTTVNLVYAFPDSI